MRRSPSPRLTDARIRGTWVYLAIRDAVGGVLEARSRVGERLGRLGEGDTAEGTQPSPAAASAIEPHRTTARKVARSFRSGRDFDVS